jgi:Hydroxypyruvate isomerase
VLIEPVSGPKPYPLRTAADAVAVVRQARAAGAANVGFLCDLYHLASNGDDLDAAIAGYAEYVAHVQIADAPGRGEPGSGQLDLDRYVADLARRGYRGWVSLEYKPTGTTEAAWPGCPGPPPRAARRSSAAPDRRRSRHEDRVYRAGIMGAPMAANLVKAGSRSPGTTAARPGSSSWSRRAARAPRTSPGR